MGTKTAMSVEQYLTTSFPDLDKEYRNGELEERSLPDYLHAKTQGLIVGFFMALRRRFPLFTCPELRLNIRPGIFLIPDVSIFYPDEPTQAVPSFPPFIAVEVLSPDDRLSKVREKLNEYRVWGVAHVWLVDPNSRRMYICDAGLLEVQILRIPELGIEVTPIDIFD